MISRLEHGFTLLETMFAIIIFTVINITVYQTLVIITKSSVAIKSRMYETSKLLEMIDAIEQDITNATEYYQVSVDEKDNKHLLFAESNKGDDTTSVYLLHCSKAILDTISYYHFETVGYRLRAKRLDRIVYIKSENLKSREGRVSKFLDGVTGFHMRVYHHGEWFNNWSNRDLLPQAIEVTMEVKNIGLIRRVIMLLNYRKGNETARVRLTSCFGHYCYNEFTSLYDT